MLQGYQPKRSLAVLMFTSEEPTRFKLSCTGSRGLAGALPPEVLDSKLDENGTSFIEVGVKGFNITKKGGESEWCSGALPCIGQQIWMQMIPL